MIGGLSLRKLFKEFTSLEDVESSVSSLRSWLSLCLFHMHARARRYAGPPSPAHGRAWFGTGGSHSVLARPVVAFKIGVTEFARVFQNRALSGGGGKPNLMLSRMGGYNADGLLAKGQPLSGFFALSATIHRWNSGLLRMESEDQFVSEEIRRLLPRPHFRPQLASRGLGGMYRAESFAKHV